MIPDFFKDISPYVLLFSAYAIGFALISSFFHYKSLLKKHPDDFRAFIRYFLYFFVLLFIIPLGVILIFFPQPLETLRSLGLQLGHVNLGALIVLIGIPCMVVISLVSSKNPGMRDLYPFSKRACENHGKFILFEICYLVFYYVAWEFTFRGVFLFGSIGWAGESSAVVLIAILIQATIATVYHLGHPQMEILGALLGSIIFGIIAYSTRSILYTIFLHALIGIMNDTFIYLRYHRTKKRL